MYIHWIFKHDIYDINIYLNWNTQLINRHRRDIKTIYDDIKLDNFWYL